MRLSPEAWRRRLSGLRLRRRETPPRREWTFATSFGQLSVPAGICEALEAALDAYEGAILLVSHDRALIDAIADETLSIEGGTLVRRDGDYEDFLAATDGGVREKTVKKAPAAPKPARRPKTTPEMRRAKELAAEVSAKEDAIAQLEAELADASVRADHQLFAQTAKAHSQRQEELRLLMRDWEEAEAAAMRSANG